MGAVVVCLRRMLGNLIHGIHGVMRLADDCADPVVVGTVPVQMLDEHGKRVL